MNFIPRKPPATVPSHQLNVVAVVSNPVGYKSRYDLFLDFMAHMKQFDVNLITVELALGDRAFEVSSEGAGNVQLRSFDEIWHKENLINLGVSRLPPDWQYVAWIDADIHFTDPRWVERTVQQLQHHMFVQLWEDCVDQGPRGEVHQHHKSLAAQYIKGIPRTNAYSFWHPGFAWAARREAFDHVGGLIDFAALGAADHHMALAFLHDVRSSVPGGISPEYLGRLLQWEARCRRYIRKDIGFVPGTILHKWHGKKKDRRYEERWAIITRNHFDPATDLKYDWQGVIQLVDSGDDRSIALRDDIRRYFRSRNEDSIDVE